MIINLIGYVAAICTTLSMLPQIIKAMKSKETKDISLSMFILLGVGVTLWLIYGILISNLPIIIANGVTMIFISFIIGLKLEYK